ncbi:MAG: TIM barrel protein [Planctomycetales bacterium]|nr:TIM barrel protein [Planctomycetales bacterium]
MSSRRHNHCEVDRRQWLLAGATAAGGAAMLTRGARAQAPASAAPSADYKIERGRIRQSVMGWCFNPMPTLELAANCKRMGMPAIEGIDTKLYPQVRELGLEISLVSSHGFKTGMCNRSQHDECVKILRERIDLAVEVGSPGVITFTGMLPDGVAPEEATRNCVEGWKKVIGYAEQKGVNLVFEHLNTRDDSHPMKGHPGYFGDDVDHCVDIIKKIDSPRMKLLFDIYHVQIMNGDVIRRIGQYHDVIGHYHTAGNPGRCELDENQEINYPAVMRAILKTGYQGYVAQEFIPTWDDKLAALRHGVSVCDV